MKTTIKTMGITAALLAAQAMPAQAINREWSAVAGFVGGLLVANAASCNRTVTYQPAPVQHVVYQPAPTVIYQSPPPPVRTGYYEWRTERTWVPGYWVYEDLGCGRQRKIWQPGYYQTTRTKVWVDTTPYACNGW